MIAWFKELAQKINQRPDGYPADWNRVYREGRLVEATPPSSTFKGCTFTDCSFGDGDALDPITRDDDGPSEDNKKGR